MSRRIVAFPHMGNYWVAARVACELFGDEAVIPPAITKRTLELGAKHSPESACIPFKYSLGTYIEALEAGANVLVQAGGGCRMGFYGELQKIILQKLGYQFEFIKLINDHNLVHIAQYVKRLYPHLSYLEIGRKLYLLYEKARLVEVVENIVRRNIGFEVEEGALERLLVQYLDALDRAETTGECRRVAQDYEARLAAIPTNKPDVPLKVGVIGEFYVVLEPFSNFFVEKVLGKYGVEIHRFLAASDVIRHAFNFKKHMQHTLAEASPYLVNDLGGHGTLSVANAHYCATHGFAGAIHVKPFACMPEISAMPALYRISQDYHFPILYFSFDTLTSETGIKTRLEAFYDMIVMKRQNDHAQSLPGC